MEFLLGLILGFILCSFSIAVLVYLSVATLHRNPMELIEKEIQRRTKARPVILDPLSEAAEYQIGKIRENQAKGKETPLEDIT